MAVALKIISLGNRLQFYAFVSLQTFPLQH